VDTRAPSAGPAFRANEVPANELPLLPFLESAQVEAAARKPFLVWDDVSGFQPPRGMSYGLCGRAAVHADFALLNFPGMGPIALT
jgi:hypothetical protein